MIESVNNERIKNYAKLKEKKYRDQDNLFIIEGDHLVEEAKVLGILVEAFSLDGSIGTKVSENVMKKLSSLTNVPNVIGIARKLENKKIIGNILMLDDIQDPGNLGTIIRSSVAFGIDTIILSKNSVDIYNPKVLRATEGMIFKINFLIDDLENALNNLKDQYTIYTTNVDGGESLHEVIPECPYIIIMGNEGNGVKPNISKYANHSLYIPITNCESLNVSIATSIILYEFNK